MSAKARFLLGELDGVEKRRYRGSSSRVSRRSSFAPGDTSTPTQIHRRPAEARTPLPEVQLPELPPPAPDTAAFSYYDDDRPRPYPHFSILSGGKNKKKAITSSPGMPAIMPRHSTSTLRSFAPPTIPTYKPRPGSFNYVPQASRGEKRTAPYNVPLDPWALPKPLDTAYPPLPSPAPESDNILRKALSIISLRSKKSGTLRPTASRSGSRLNPQFEKPSFDMPPLPHFPLPPNTPPKLSRSATADDLTKVVSRSRLDIEWRNDDNSTTSRNLSRDRSRMTSRPESSGEEGSQILGQKRRDWFDGIDEGGEEEYSQDEGWIHGHQPSASSYRQQQRERKESTISSRHQSKVHKRDSGSIPIHKRGTSNTSSKDMSRPVKSAHARLKSSAAKGSHHSVVYEQTMVNLSDSDDSGIAVAHGGGKDKSSDNSRTKSSKGADTTDLNRGLYNAHVHKQSTSRSNNTSRPPPSSRNRNRAHSSQQTQSSSAILDEARPVTTDDSDPSLAGSSSSRRNSWLSSGPISPPLFRQTRQHIVQAPSNDLDSGLSTPQDAREFAESIISDLKHGSKINRIVAVISSEEAILISKIRRNRADALTRLSVVQDSSIISSPPSSPKRQSRISHKQHVQSSSHSKTPSADATTPKQIAITTEVITENNPSAAAQWAARRLKAQQKAMRSKQPLPLQFPVVPSRVPTRANSVSVRQPGSQQAPGSRMSVMGNLMTSSLLTATANADGHYRDSLRSAGSTGNIVNGTGGARIPLVIGTGRKIPIGRVQERKEAWEARQRAKAGGATTSSTGNGRVSGLPEEEIVNIVTTSRKNSASSFATRPAATSPSTRSSIGYGRGRRSSPPFASLTTLTTPPPTTPLPPLPPMPGRAASRPASSKIIATAPSPSYTASSNNSFDSPSYDIDLASSRPTTPSTIRHISQQPPPHPLVSSTAASPHLVHNTANALQELNPQYATSYAHASTSSSEFSSTFMDSPASDDSPTSDSVSIGGSDSGPGVSPSATKWAGKTSGERVRELVSSPSSEEFFATVPSSAESNSGHKSVIFVPVAVVGVGGGKQEGVVDKGRLRDSEGNGKGDAMKAWLEMCGGGGAALEAW